MCRRVMSAVADAVKLLLKSVLCAVRIKTLFAVLVMQIQRYKFILVLSGLCMKIESTYIVCGEKSDTKRNMQCNLDTYTLTDYATWLNLRPL